jgi:Flp pilus assembly protein TadD
VICGCQKRTLVKLAALIGLSSVLNNCAALPALEAGAAVISGLSQLSGLPDKLSNFFHSSSAQEAADASMPPKVVTEPDFLRGGDSVSARGDFVTAAWFYGKAANANPNSLQARIRLANAQRVLKDDDNAYANYQMALILSPKDANASMPLGEIELTRGDAKAALVHFRLAMQSRQSDSKLYNLMGVAFTMEGQYALARQSFEVGLKLKPNYPSLQNNYGMMQLQSGDYEAAVGTFTKLVQSPYTSERYRTNLALAEIAIGSVDAALLDAPGMDEAMLRHMLARYQPRSERMQMAAADNIQIDIHPSAGPREDTPTAVRNALIAPTLIPQNAATVVKRYYDNLPSQPN